MGKPLAPSMPTPKQIEQAFSAAKELCPGVRIKAIGPDGVSFEYPEENSAAGEWEGKPFSGAAE
ncbi:hypothetical protein [Sulfitobacter sp. S190]|uniref:hypothetical protein n=1 Tax=Sulfitobacter sp. S190 TaxID=2867022 RepID=UPI0021A4FD6C|nr:hypothetical protein [Sulfitobacter sp. S190]UWR22626.1 hypothetical protein K3756_01115 [Sulfitobacter sp. S190]